MDQGTIEYAKTHKAHMDEFNRRQRARVVLNSFVRDLDKMVPLILEAVRELPEHRDTLVQVNNFLLMAEAKLRDAVELPTEAGGAKS